MTFRADISHALDELKMARWEMCVYDFSRRYNNSLVEMLVLGSEIVDQEMGAEAEKTVPYFVMGEWWGRGGNDWHGTVRFGTVFQPNI